MERFGTVRSASLLLAALVWFLPSSAQADDGCGRCREAAKVVDELRCSECVGDEACDACAARAEALRPKVACASCSDEAACEACAVEEGKCVRCAAEAAVAARIYCGDACEQAKSPCEKCQELRKLVGVVCMACKGKAETVSEVTTSAAKLGSFLAGWFKFKLQGVNGNAEGQRTVKGKVVLLAADGSEVGSGTIYLEVPAGETVTRVITIKEKGAWTDFKVIVEKVFDF